MNYLLHYQKLIDRARNRNISGYVEKHHILPRCLGGGDHLENLVDLFPEEHYLAHLLLVKIYPDNKGLIVAAMFLTSNSKNRKSNNKIHGWLKRKLSEQMSGDNHPLRKNQEFRNANQQYMRSENNPQRKNPRCGINHHFYGKKNPFEFSLEARIKLSISKRGENNPYYGLWGWKHPTCKGESRNIWKQADQIYNLHQNFPTYGYSKISKILNLDTPYRSMGVLQKIKEGWNPHLDLSWKEFKEREI